MNDFEKLADKITSDWWDHLFKVGQLGTPIEKLDEMYWAELDASIARELEKVAKETAKKYQELGMGVNA